MRSLGVNSVWPWSTWQYVNLSLHGAEFASHLNDLRRNSQVMFAAFLRASRAVRRGGAGLRLSGLDTALGGSSHSCRGFLLILMLRLLILTAVISGCRTRTACRSGSSGRLRRPPRSSLMNSRVENANTRRVTFMRVLRDR